MYGTVNAADDYLGARAGGEVWLALTESQKSAWLTSAFDVIESLDFQGDKTDPAQETEFPRDGASTVPSNVEYAQYQLAMCMIMQGYNPAASAGPQIKRAQSGPVETEYFEGVPLQTLEGVYCPRAWALIKPYIIDPDEITIVRSS